MAPKDALERKMERKEERNRERGGDSNLIFIALAILFLSIISYSSLVSSVPTGPSNINVTSNETKAPTNGTMVNISGGYLSKLNITATVQNEKWKAFLGWIDGRFTLDDASGSTIYDWSLSTVSGEVYSTRQSGAITWGSIACANSTQINAEDVALEHTGSDNISSTFSENNTDTYIVSGIPIGVNNCFSTNTYNDTGAQDTLFEEIVLYDTSNIVYATKISNEVGYDGSNYDFQMIVPENGNESFSGSTAYYLYVELES